jgi:hypothetical protein
MINKKNIDELEKKLCQPDKRMEIFWDHISELKDSNQKFQE